MAVSKLVFHVFAALAEFERDLIRERTAAGLAAARARGRYGGRPSVMNAHKLRVAEEMYRPGQYTVAVIAKTLVEEYDRLLVGLVVDFGVGGGVALDRLDAVDRAGLALIGLASGVAAPSVPALA